MASSLLALRLLKIMTMVRHPVCWRAACLGVAPAIEHLPALRGLSVDGVIDVGGNRGQFTFACRLAGLNVPIVAFEPIPAEAAKYRVVHGGVPGITLIESALGDAAGTAELHLSRSADSSSLLPIGRAHVDIFPATEEVGTITVAVRRLDDLAANWAGRSRQLLKLDVQGFELNVLRGAEATLLACSYVYAECSEIVLYEGQALRPAIVQFLGAHGFSEQGRFNPQYQGAQLVQADYLFKRTGVA